MIRKLFRRRPIPTRYLGAIFAFAVVIPSIILALMAVRAINREEAYIEKQLESTLLAEVTHVVSVVGGLLQDIELDSQG